MATEVFVRQAEAWDFVRSISDAKTRLLTELALARALSFLVSDPDYLNRVQSSPLDLMTYARAVSVFVANGDRIRQVLDGEIASVDDLDPFGGR